MRELIAKGGIKGLPRSHPLSDLHAYLIFRLSDIKDFSANNQLGRIHWDRLGTKELHLHLTLLENLILLGTRACVYQFFWDNLEES